MARHAPKDTLNQILHMTQVWESLRPAKSFAGLTLAQFKQTMQPSQAVRAEIIDLENRLRAALALRADVDATALATMQRVVNGVKGDVEEGEDGELYAAMGYVRKSVRNSGLTRKKDRQASEA